MEGLNVVCTWNSQRRTFYFQISSSLFCLYSVLLSSGEAFKWMNSFCWYCTQAFLEKAFSSDISNSGLQVLLLSQSMCSPRHPDTGFTFVEITLKEQPREDGMWNNCGTRLMFVACQCRSAQPYTFFPFTLLFAPLSQHLTKKEVSLACRRTASTRQQSSHYKWRGNGLLFCSVLGGFLALGCTSEQTIIAFSSLGSSLFSIWSLPPSDFKIGGGGV